VEKEVRYTVVETTEELQLSTESKASEKVLQLHKISRTPGGRKVQSRVVASFWSRETLDEYLAAKAIDPKAVTFPAPAK